MNEHPGPKAHASALRILGDLSHFAERLAEKAERYGPAGVESLLGAYGEWLGVDLADAFVVLPKALWNELDEIAEGILQAARRYLRSAEEGEGAPEAITELRSLAERARETAKKFVA